MVKKEKWREKLEQFKQDDRYDYLIELLLPYTAGFRAGSLDRGFLPILCEVEELLDKAREEGRKEGDIASDFLYWHPLGGGMPDSSIRIGVEFEVGGCYEDWGFVIEQYRRRISSGRTLKEAISKLTTK